MKILFDITRMINRCTSPIPSGIDRVDINYLNHFCVSDKYTAIGVYQNQGRLISLSEHKTKDICNRIYEVWCKMKEHDSKYFEKIRKIFLGQR